MFKKLFLTIIAIFLLLQFFRTERTNPQRTGNEMNIPEYVQPILARACFDCHSHDTKWPWYSNIMPVTYLLTNHVNEGRKHLNFSEWGTYSQNKKENKLLEICEEIEEKKMPLEQYLMLHSEATLSQEDIKTICDWADGVRNELQSSSKTGENDEE